MLYSIGFTEKGHAPEPPVGHENDIIREAIRGRQTISKIIPGYEIEIDSTVRAGKEAVSLSQSDRSAALRTLMFDFPGAWATLRLHKNVPGGSRVCCLFNAKFRAIFFHRIDCNK